MAQYTSSFDIFVSLYISQLLFFAFRKRELPKKDIVAKIGTEIAYTIKYMSRKGVLYSGQVYADNLIVSVSAFMRGAKTKVGCGYGGSITHMRTFKAQTSLRVRAVWLEPLLFAHSAVYTVFIFMLVLKAPVAQQVKRWSGGLAFSGSITV